jgi:hypothetical protein
MGTADAEEVHAKLIAEISTIRKRFARVLASALILMLITIGSLIVYANHVGKISTKASADAIKLAEERQAADLRKFCVLLVTLDDQNKKIAKPTPSQAVFIKQLHDLVLSYNCKPN